MCFFVVELVKSLKGVILVYGGEVAKSLVIVLAEKRKERLTALFLFIGFFGKFYLFIVTFIAGAVLVL